MTYFLNVRKLDENNIYLEKGGHITDENLDVKCRDTEIMGKTYITLIPILAPTFLPGDLTWIWFTANIFFNAVSLHKISSFQRA